MLRILYDDFDQKVKNIHDEMDLHYSYKKKACNVSSHYYFYLLITTPRRRRTSTANNNASL